MKLAILNKFIGFQFKILRKFLTTHSLSLIYLLPIVISGCGFVDEKTVTATKAVLHPLSLENSIRGNEGRAEAKILFQASGWIEPDPYPIRVPSLYDGIVDEVFVLEGETVKKGQKVASLIDDDARLAFNLSKIQLEEARLKELELSSDIKMSRSTLMEARNKLKQHKSTQDEQIDYVNRLASLPIGSLPEVDFFQARKKADSLRFSTNGAAAKVEEAEGRIELLSNQLNSLRKKTEFMKILKNKAQLDLNRTLIYSPMDGVVLKLLASPGKKLMQQMDSPDSSTVLILFEADKLQARIDVPLVDASKLSLEQEVEILCSMLPDQKFKGTLTRITGAADFQRNTLQVKVRLLNPDNRLRPEMLCRAKFFSSTNKSKEIDPPSSLGVFVPLNLKPAANQTIGDLWVIGADGRSAELREVRFGKEVTNKYVSVTSGLNAGDLIILNPPSSIKSGDRIKISKFQ